MNTLLFNAHCFDKQIDVICEKVLWIVIIIAILIVVVNILKFVQSLITCNYQKGKKDNSSTIKGVKEKEQLLELQRQDRVRALLKEIASISSDKIVYDETKEKKGYYEKYNDTEANNLFQLYQKLDKYIIIKEIADGEQQQS